jgi:hypothetical protein
LQVAVAVLVDLHPRTAVQVADLSLVMEHKSIGPIPAEKVVLKAQAVHDQNYAGVQPQELPALAAMVLAARMAVAVAVADILAEAAE